MTIWYDPDTGEQLHLFPNFIKDIRVFGWRAAIYNFWWLLVHRGGSQSQ